LWNALPGVDKRLKVGDRKALIDKLWSAIEIGGSLGTQRIHGLWHIIEGALQASGRAGSRQVKLILNSFSGLAGTGIQRHQSVTRRSFEKWPFLWCHL
jgi:hypothetical protein